MKNYNIYYNFFTMTKFQIASDLHIEYKNNELVDPLTIITPSADYLILAGDIGSFYKYEQLHKFIYILSKYYKSIIYVPGNNEYYTQIGFEPKSMDELLQNFKRVSSYINNLYILDRACIKIGDICIAGCTLWSNPTVYIPKFIVRINSINTNMYIQKHEKDLAYIKYIIKYCQTFNLKLLLVTHYCPTYSLINPLKSTNKYISMYVSNLDFLHTKDQIHTWVYGHTHANFNVITDKGTRLVTNQVGKPKDNIKDYNKNMVIEI